ncbi:MAG: hypothetical protein ACTSU2_14965 [Promethearchaeota archaeon]
MKKIHFRIPAEQIAEGKFPIILEDTHGDPPHQVIFKINRNFEVESFEIKEAIHKNKIMTSKFTREILKDYGLTDEEIDLHITCFGLGPVTVGEMARLVDLPAERIKEIAKKFVEKGFFKEILGAREYYQALPPYPALIEQLEEFNKYIAKIKEDTPKNLSRSFESFEKQAEGVQKLKNFVDYLSHLNANITNNIKDEKENLDKTLSLLNQEENIKAIQNLQTQAVTLIEDQFKNLNDQLMSSLETFDSVFARMEKDLDSSMDRFDKRIDKISENLDSLKQKLSENFGKLRLGVIQKVVEDVLNKTFLMEVSNIKNSFKRDLNKELEGLVGNLKSIFLKELKEPLSNTLTSSQKYFKEALEEPFKNLIVDVANRLRTSSENASQIGDNLKTTFNKIVEEFSSKINESQNMVMGISDEVLHSFSSLRETFTKTVISELDNMLEKVKNRLQLSSLTVEEFWEEAKNIATVSMQDVWFIRTPEGMISQINEEVLKAKMRVLIVAPSLSDIEIEPIFAIKPQINVRICCSIDPSNAKHQAILKRLEEKPNVSLRNRKLQNLWGINRDYEEIILGIVSKVETTDEGTNWELVGLGSNLQEHIKILVPILEEAWMGSKKDIFAVSPMTTIKSPSKAPGHTMGASKFTKVSEGATSRPSISTPKTPVGTPGSTSTPLTAQSPSQTSSGQQEQNAMEYPKEPEREKAKAPSEVLQNILSKIDTLISQLNTIDTKVLAQELVDLRDYIFENKGFSKILNDIKNWASQVRKKGDLDKDTIKILKGRMEYWKQGVLK